MNGFRHDSLHCSARSAVTVLLALVGGCQEEGLPHFGTLRYASDNYEVWASEGLEACAGTFPYVENWLPAFRERISQHDDPAKHTFYWLSPDEYDRDICPVGIACAYPHS